MFVLQLQVTLLQAWYLSWHKFCSIGVGFKVLMGMEMDHLCIHLANPDDLSEDCFHCL